MDKYNFEQAKIEYRAFCEAGEHDIQIFAQPWYLDAVCKSPDDWRVIIIKEGARIVAAFPFEYTRSKKGILRIGNPWQAARLGIWMDYGTLSTPSKRESFENQLVKKIISLLPPYDVFQVQFDSRFQNWREFYNAGFSQTVYYSYIIPYNQIDNNYTKMITSNTKRKLNKAKCIYECDNHLNLNEYWEFFEYSYKKRNRVPSYSQDMAKRLISESLAHKAGAIYGAKSEQNKLCASDFVLFDTLKAYYMFGTFDPDIKPSPMILLIDSFINSALDNGLCADFEGSMIPGIAEYYSQFGGIREPYYVITNYSDRFKFYMNCKECFDIMKRSATRALRKRP